MRKISLILVPLSLIIYVVNLVFQISAHVPNNHLTEKVFAHSYLAETLGNLNTPYTIPYWCFLVEVLIYIFTFATIILHCGAELLRRGSRISLVSILALDAAKIIDCAWVVLYNRYDIMRFNILSIIQCILLIIGCCFLVRGIRRSQYMNLTINGLIYVKIIAMNAFFGYLAWSYYRLVSDVALGVYAFYYTNYWISAVPNGILLFGYIVYYMFDAIAFPEEFRWTISPYIVYMCLLGGLLADKDLLNPEITLPGLLVSCTGTIVVVTFVHKVGSCLRFRRSRGIPLFDKTDEL